MFVIQSNCLDFISFYSIFINILRRKIKECPDLVKHRAIFIQIRIAVKT